MPLQGKKILVTRAQEDAHELSDLLRKYGALPLEFPTIEFQEINPNLKRDKALASIDSYSYLIFTSAHAVKFFCKYFFKLHKKEDLSHLKILCIGSETRACLGEFGITSAFVPKDFRGEGISAYVKNEKNISQKKILFPRALEARNIIEDELRKCGARVTIIPLYRSLKPRTENKLRLVLAENKIDCITFLSSKTCSNFFILLGDRYSTYVNGVLFAVIGPITNETLQKFGYHAIVPRKYTIESLVESLCEYYQDRKKNYADQKTSQA